MYYPYFGYQLSQIWIRKFFLFLFLCLVSIQRPSSHSNRENTYGRKIPRKSLSFKQEFITNKKDIFMTLLPFSVYVVLQSQMFPFLDSWQVGEPCFRIMARVMGVRTKWEELYDVFIIGLTSFNQALNGFIMMATQTGKLLYISDNAAEYLGHSMVTRSYYKFCMI